MQASEELPLGYVQGIRCFNEHDFFESHELLEDVWKSAEESSRRFYQGLIQAAVALLHFSNGNTVGARKLYWASREKLQAYQQHYLGLDVTDFLRQMSQCFRNLLADPSETPVAELDQRHIPVIELSPPFQSAVTKL